MSSLGDAVEPVLDEMNLKVQREQPTIDLDILSMGMSDDLRVAVEEGAPAVRISHAIYWASCLATIGLTRPFPFVSVPRDRRDSRRMRGQLGNVIDDLRGA